MGKIRVFIVDDHYLIVESLKAILEKEKKCTVAGQARDGNEAIEKLKTTDCDIILMDISLNGMSGLETSRIILKSRSDIKIIIMTMHESYQYICEAFKIGAKGYLLKEESYKELERAICDVYDGKIYYSQKIKDIIANKKIETLINPKITDSTETLSKIEFEILTKLAVGLTIKEISSEMNLSEKTIYLHRNNIFKILDFKNSTDLVKYVIKNKLIEI